MMRSALRSAFAPRNVRTVAGISPMLYVRNLPVVSKADPTDAFTLRSKVSGLKRFAKAQLAKVADEDVSLKTQLAADIQRYDSYMNNVDLFVEEGRKWVDAGVKLMFKLDRYPQMTLQKIDECRDILEKKLTGAHAILEQQPLLHIEVDADYWASSKFKVLNVNQGVVACLPAGDFPPGAIELLKDQVIETIIDGEPCHIEIEGIAEGMQVLWFKPDIKVPAEALIMWSYATNDATVGTKWLTQENVVARLPTPEIAEKLPVVAAGETDLANVEPGDWAVEIFEESPEVVEFPPPAPYLQEDLFKPVVNQLEAARRPGLEKDFKDALISYGTYFDLNAEYASHFDREVVEAKRDRYYKALVSASTKEVTLVNPVELGISYVVSKSKYVDRLRRQEGYVNDQILLARLHERRLAGEHIERLEELDYMPHIRDDLLLEEDCNELLVLTGRYDWQLYPHIDGNPDAYNPKYLCKDVPPQTDPVSNVWLKHMKAKPIHSHLEAKVFGNLTALLAIQRKEADAASGAVWPLV